MGDGPMSASVLSAKQVAMLREGIEGLRRPHEICEDCWYSCPKSDECCNEHEDPTICRCGADAHNAKVDALLAIFGQPYVPGAPESVIDNIGPGLT